MKKYLFYLGCWLMMIPCLTAQIQRVEPVNWWVGMKARSLQILVYGENMGKLNPKIENSNMTLEKVVKVENQNYLFLYVRIPANAKAGKVPIVFYDAKNKAKETYDFQLNKREAGRAEIEGFDSSDLLYLVTPDRFVNGNPENDSHPFLSEKANRADKNARHGGDIQGLNNSLDYISDMGFTAIWLNPILENNMPELSYHGYSTTDFYKVDTRFGTNKEYKKFCADARKKGIKIIMDMIVNHPGSEHWMVKDKPTKDWLNFPDKFVKTTFRTSTVMDIYTSDDDSKRYSDGWFVKTMPDFNQRNPLLADYLIQNSIWWIEYSGISGIRMDTYPLPDKAFMTRWAKEVMEEYPNFNIVGEIWVSNPAVLAYWQKGKMNHDGYVSYLPSMMDFPLQAKLAQALTNEEKAWDSGLIQLYDILINDMLYPNPQNLVTFGDNHDTDRIYTQLNEDSKLLKMAVSYLLTMRGTPQLYYGTEVLFSNKGANGDHTIIRSDFPGGWQSDKINGFTGEGLSDAQKEMKDYIKKLANWRKNKSVIHTGKLKHFVAEKGVYIFFRYNDNEKVMVILNKNAEETTLEVSRFAEMLNDSKTATDVMTGQTFETTESMTLKPTSAYILELK